MRKAKVSRSLRRDLSAESVMRPFILIIVFVALMAVLIGGVSQYIVAGSLQSEFHTIDFPFGLSNYTSIDADTDDERYFYDEDREVGGYIISEDDVLDYVPHPEDEDPFLFWKADAPEEIKYVHVIMDNQNYDPSSNHMWKKYKDFIAVRRDTGDLIGERWNGAAIPFTEICDNYWEGEQNASVTDFRLSNSQDTIFAFSDVNGSANFTEALYDSDFYLCYGWARFRMEETDFWNAISMLFYNDIPDVSPIINDLIHIFVIAVSVFVIFTMAVRMTPFLGGA